MSGPYLIPPGERGSAIVGGPSFALAPKWWRLDDGTVTVRCMCGHLRGLEGHTVDEAGNVTPSVECPTASCGWHVFARLDGWGERLL